MLLRTVGDGHGATHAAVACLLLRFAFWKLSTFVESLTPSALMKFQWYRMFSVAAIS